MHDRRCPAAMKHLEPPSSALDSENPNLLNRRTFLSRTLIAGTSAVALPQFVRSAVLGADVSVPPGERTTVGLIGVGAMGSGHLRRVAHDSAFELLAVCEVDRERRNSAKKAVEDIYSNRTGANAYRGCAACND